MTSEEIQKLKDKCNEIILCNKSKVSWKQLGGVVVVVIAVLGFAWTGLDLTRSGEIKNIKNRCNENSKSVQTFSVNQAVIADKLKDVDHRLEKMEEKREKDIRIMHQRITSTKDAIIKEIRKLDK